MESIDFLKEQLQILFERLPYLQIKYEYRGRLDTHIIHVLPTFCFEKDKLYAELQFELEDKFDNLFYEESILFITDNELIQIENPIFELGISGKEIVFDIIEPPILANYSFNTKEQFIIDTGFDQYYEIPTFNDTGTFWGKFKKALNKKDLDKQHQGLFFV